MAILALDPSDPAADGSRYALMRTALPEVWLRRYWLGWFIANQLTSTASLFVILLIMLRPKLRAQTFNKFIVGTVLPDFIFSFCCAWTCWSHYSAGHWHGGATACNIQGVYLIYGTAGSLWMQVATVYELHRLAKSLATVSIYRAPSARVVWTRVGCVQLAALLWAMIPLLPGVPAAYGQHRGLACINMEYDRASSIFHWLGTMSFINVIPCNILLFYVRKMYLLLFRGSAVKCTANQAIFFFFLRIILVYLILWTPFAIFVWMETDAGGHVTFWGGTLGHLQGFVSACMYLCKGDIWAEAKHLVTACKLRALAWPRAVPLYFSSQTSISSNDSGPVARAFMERLSRDVLAKICQEEQAPMKVVELDAWLGLGTFPRSSDSVARPLQEGDVVVFISHRWWDDTCPDDANGTKYAILSRGVCNLAARHRLDRSKVVLWCDWACIEQDDPHLQAQGIASLITYAARSSFVLIPVSSDPACARAFRDASHPMMLLNYGERAWCRLEVYIFMCVAEICRKPPYCYGYGSVASCAGRESLRPLTRSFGKGAAFDYSKLPSAGELTHEKDRTLIRSIEEAMRDTYTHTAILAEKLKLESMSRRHACKLQEKQIRCVDMLRLTREIFAGVLAPRIVELRLDGNLLAAEGMAVLLQGIVCAESTASLEVLSLSNNPHLGGGAMEHLADSLAHPCFTLAVLHLSSCALSEDDVLPLVQSLPDCRTLRHLNLSRNLLGDAIGEKLLEACGGSDKPFVLLDLDGNPLSAHCMLKAARAQIAVELGHRSIGPLECRSTGQSSAWNAEAYN